MTQEELDALLKSDNYEDDIKEFEGATCDIKKAPETTKENRVVYQLDEVSEEAEKKAALIFDKLDSMSESANRLEELVNSDTPKEVLLEEIVKIQSTIFETISIMQFHDIHRQKIERVISVMRELSGYMNHLLEGKIEDSSRGQIAKHISGDDNEVVDEDDLESLINSFNK
jgi:hypothetical protein